LRRVDVDVDADADADVDVFVVVDNFGFDSSMMGRIILPFITVYDCREEIPGTCTSTNYKTN